MYPCWARKKPATSPAGPEPMMTGRCRSGVDPGTGRTKGVSSWRSITTSPMVLVPARATFVLVGQGCLDRVDEAQVVLDAGIEALAQDPPGANVVFPAAQHPGQLPRERSFRLIEPHAQIGNANGHADIVGRLAQVRLICGALHGLLFSVPLCLCG